MISCSFVQHSIVQLSSVKGWHLNDIADVTVVFHRISLNITWVGLQYSCCILDRSLGSLSPLAALGYLHIAAVSDLEFQAWSRNLHKSFLTTSRPNRSKYSERFQ